MNSRLKAVAAILLAASFTSSYAIASEPVSPAKKHTAHKAAKVKGPTVEEQIEALRKEMQGQIEGLKSDIATKDSQLKQAQQAAADAQAAAAKAQEAAASEQQAVTDNQNAVSTLQSTVTDMKGANASAVASFSDEATAIKKSIANPSTLHYKGINLTPGGFVAAETVWRSRATGGDIPTPFSAIPYEGADAYKLSEFFGGARQSRLSLLAEGKTDWGTMRGYYEADFLGTGITSNNNQSNSYVMRQRIIYAQAETHSHLTFAAGQLWSLATEQKKGITSAPGDVTTPQTIDPNYVPGFVWTRQYGFRVVKNYNKFAFGIAAENPQILYTAALAGNTPYAVLGSAGNNGGNYNAAINGVSTKLYVQNYTNIPGATSPSYAPKYALQAVGNNIANLSFNQAPDLIFKITADPGLGHYEGFGIVRFAQESVYPNMTTDRVLYGGQTDIGTGAVVVAAANTTGSFVNHEVLYGGGGSFRLPVIKDKLTVGAKGMYGFGVGRYGNTTLADVTANSWGGLEPIENVSGLVTVEATPTPRLVLYANYGGDYAGRKDFASAATTSLADPKACFLPTGATVCTTSPTAVQLAAGGKWGGTWAAPSTFVPVGYGSRYASNSSCSTTTNPSYNGSSTGYYAGGSCGAHTRDVQEGTLGYWYDLYKGEKGRLRQGLQYGYAVREGWSGASGIGAKGIDNMFWTSFRYYLP